MTSTKCHGDAKLRIDQEREDYVGTVTCVACGTTRKHAGDSVLDVVNELLKDEVTDVGGKKAC